MSLRRLLKGHDRLYYMAPMANAPFIAALGIFSYNQIHSRKEIADNLSSIADPAVNLRRHGITFEGRQLHYFVPLYWATHTPMQYVITVRDQEIPQDDLVFFLVDAEPILQLENVWTTDGNAASNATTFYRGPDALPEIDWRVIDTMDAYSKEYKRKKCAEVLVPDHVPTDYITQICVRTPNAASILRRAIEAFSQRELAVPQVRVDPSLYY